MWIERRRRSTRPCWRRVATCARSARCIVCCTAPGRCLSAADSDVTRIGTHHSWWPRPPTKFGPGISHAWLGRASGVTYPLNVVLDLFSRYVVAWMVAARESATRAKRLIRNACQKQGIQAGQLTLHQDRGAPMTAKTFSQLLIDLDTPQRDRPADAGRRALRPRQRNPGSASKRVLNDVYTQHPERFVNGPPRPPQVPGEVWINQPQNTIECERIRQ